MNISGGNITQGRCRRAEEAEAAGVTVEWRERCASQVLAGRPHRLATKEKVSDEGYEDWTFEGLSRDESRPTSIGHLSLDESWSFNPKRERWLLVIQFKLLQYGAHHFPSFYVVNLASNLSVPPGPAHPAKTAINCRNVPQCA
jgi:hypothetical protein